MKPSISRKKDCVIIAQLYASKPFWILNLKVTLLSFFQKKKKKMITLAQWSACGIFVRRDWCIFTNLRRYSFLSPQSNLQSPIKPTHPSQIIVIKVIIFTHFYLQSYIHSFAIHVKYVTPSFLKSSIHTVSGQPDLPTNSDRGNLSWNLQMFYNQHQSKVSSLKVKHTFPVCFYAFSLLHSLSRKKSYVRTLSPWIQARRDKETNAFMYCTWFGKTFHKRTKQLLKLGAETPKTWTASELVKTL